MSSCILASIIISKVCWKNQERLKAVYLVICFLRSRSIAVRLKEVLFWLNKKAENGEISGFVQGHAKRYISTGLSISEGKVTKDLRTGT